MNKLRNYFVQRAPLMGTFAALGCFSALNQTPATEPGEEGVRAAIATVSELEVGTFLWEPSRGALLDWWVGRGIVFEGREENDSSGKQPGSTRLPRDIYRMMARVSWEGHLLDLGSLRNLTQTASGDETDLVGNRHGALFASRATSIPSSISLLDYAGEPQSRDINLVGRIQLGLSRLIDSGTWKGLGRVDFLPAKEGDELAIGLSATEVQIQWKGQGRDLDADVNMGALWDDKAGSPIAPLDSSQLTLFSRDREPIPWTHFGANVAREFVGTGTVAWLEGRLFETWDALHRAGYSVSHQSKSVDPAPPVPLTYAPSATEGIWPPANIEVGDGFPKKDGKWTALRSKLHELEGAPYFYRTVLHADAERPYAELHLVAFDMRRLELGMRAGYEIQNQTQVRLAAGNFPATSPSSEWLPPSTAPSKRTTATTG